MCGVVQLIEICDSMPRFLQYPLVWDPPIEAGLIRGIEKSVGILNGYNFFQLMNRDEVTGPVL